MVAKESSKSQDGTIQEKTTRGKTIEIYKPGVYENLKARSESDGIDIKKQVNEIIELYFEREELLKKYLPDLEKINFKDGIFFIEDKKLDSKLIRVGIGKNSKITCTTCNSNDCIHVFYSLSQMELGRIGPVR